mgnify:FL=1
MIEITDREFKLLAAYIKENYGIYLKDEKKILVMGRLQNVLIQNNLKSFKEYYEYVISDKTGNAKTELINKITTNHTFFMREPEHFNFFTNQVLPELVGEVKDKDLRVWSAGCSTGEEPYTLAMLIDETLGKSKVFWDTKILATDISTKVLEDAQRGIYTSEKIATLPALWKQNYFKQVEDGSYAVTNKIKQEVIYRKFNLMEKAFPFRKKFHVIFCRNVMIYFNAETKRELVNKFYDSLEYGGYLFIGHSESLNREETKFKSIRPAVYRKI